jgi:hypothetical protein
MVDEAQRQRTNFKRPEYFREPAPYNPNRKPEYFRELAPYNPDENQNILENLIVQILIKSH